MSEPMSEMRKSVYRQLVPKGKGMYGLEGWADALEECLTEIDRQETQLRETNEFWQGLSEEAKSHKDRIDALETENHHWQNTCAAQMDNIAALIQEIADLQSHSDALQHQNADLLAACEALVDPFESALREALDLPNAEELAANDGRVLQARAAIRAAKEDKQ